MARMNTTLKRRYTVIDASVGFARLLAEGDAIDGSECLWRRVFRG